MADVSKTLLFISFPTKMGFPKSSKPVIYGLVSPFNLRFFSGKNRLNPFGPPKINSPAFVLNADPSLNSLL